MSVNVSLALFNLLPIAPLDGGTVLIGVLSAVGQRWAYELARALERFQSQAPMVFLLVILANQMFQGRILGLVLRAPWMAIMRLLLGS
jgi:Zn-dependent protease